MAIKVHIDIVCSLSKIQIPKEEMLRQMDILIIPMNMRTFLATQRRETYKRTAPIEGEFIAGIEEFKIT